MTYTYKRQELASQILIALQQLGGSATRQEVKQYIADHHVGGLTPSDVFGTITSENNKKYSPFNLDFGFGLINLKTVGAVDYVPHSRNSKLALTDYGKDLLPAEFPSASDQAKIDHYWRQKHNARQAQTPRTPQIWLFAGRLNDFDSLTGLNWICCLSDIQKGDTVYIYSTEPDKGIRVKAQVVKVDLCNDDEQSQKKHVRLKLVKVYSDGEAQQLAAANLRQHGLKKVADQQNITHNKTLIAYLERVEHPTYTTSLQNHNLIYYGAPGTGKSYMIQQLILQTYSQYSETATNTFSKQVIRTTLYADYAYSDFVGQIMPLKKANSLTYGFMPGPFAQALLQAYLEPSMPVFLVLEEMSRANVAAVFGDLFQLLDRNEQGVSEYSIVNYPLTTYLADNGIHQERIYLPANFYILGSLNTSDQNVFTLDTAFKRRFAMQYVPITTNDALNDPLLALSNDLTVFWCDFLTVVNDYIVNVLGLAEDKQLGQFFVRFKSKDPSYNRQEFQNKVLQYLYDDVDGTFAFHEKEGIFDNAIKGFGTLYQRFSEGQNIFSDELLTHLREKNHATGL